MSGVRKTFWSSPWLYAASVATPLKWGFVVGGIGGAAARPVAAGIRALAARRRSGR